MQDKEAIKELEKLNFYVDEVARVTYHSNGKIKSMEGVKNFKFLGDERSKTNQDKINSPNKNVLPLMNLKNAAFHSLLVRFIGF